MADKSKTRPDEVDRKKLTDELRRLAERLYEENQRLRDKIEAYESSTLEEKNGKV